VNDEASMAAAIAERSLLEALAVGCSAPVGGYAAGTERLLMHAAVLSPDGTRGLRAHGSAPAADARRLGRDLAAELLRRGASDLISSPMAPTSSRNDAQ
jgi:hydroxymethylbilane synthase